jgi:cell wall-associated NlpC family hydrolase
MIAGVATREELLKEAYTWIRTPYLKGGMVKGSGCDCATFPYSSYRVCGLIGDEQIGVFSDDWAANAKEEIYMFRILRHARKVAEGMSYPTLKAAPGNILLVKTEGARVYDHAAIVVKWPRVLHSAPCSPGYVTEVDASKHFLFAFKNVHIFDPWAKHGLI